mgnify:CR=1 FL=1
MSKAYVFPGQGAQFVGMGKDLYESNSLARELFEKANDVLGFRITDTMFEGTDEELKQTKITQPAVFLHSVILYGNGKTLFARRLCAHLPCILRIHKEPQDKLQGIQHIGHIGIHKHA